MKVVISVDVRGDLWVQLPQPDNAPAGLRIDVPPVRVRPGEVWEGIPYIDLLSAGPGEHDLPDPT